MGLYGKKSLLTVDKAVSANEPFKLNGGSMSGARTDTPGYGRMSTDLQEMFKADRHIFGITYVINSYATPIAWQLGNGNWVVPTVTYSATTTGHQSAVKNALRENGWRNPKPWQIPAWER